MASLYIAKWQQFHDDSGDPLNGGTLTFYLTTTTTAKSAYPTEADALAGTNAFTTRTLDADGRCPTEVWLSGRYRIITKTSAGTTIADDDPIEDVVSASDAQDGSPIWAATAGGTATALTLSFTPALTALTDGMTIGWRWNADTAGATTVNPDGIGAKSLVKRDGTAIAAGDGQQNDIATARYNSTQNRFELMSPDGALYAHQSPTLTGTWTFTQASPFVFEGATDNAFETTLAITDPTADRTVTVPDATGTLAMDSAGFSGATGLYGLGGLYKIQSQTASASAQLDFSIPSGFTQVVFVLKNIAPATDDTELAIRFSTDAGVSFISTGTYRTASNMFNTAGTDVGEYGNTTTAILLCGTAVSEGMGNAAGETGSGVLTITGLNESARPNVSGTFCFHGSAANDFIHGTAGGSIDTAATYNAVRFLMMSGNIASGTITMYGIK